MSTAKCAVFKSTITKAGYRASSIELPTQQHHLIYFIKRQRHVEPKFESMSHEAVTVYDA